MDEQTVMRLSESGVRFIWDRFLPKGKVAQDMNGLWHVGEGTDLNLLLFEANLTSEDRRFLESVKITT